MVRLTPEQHNKLIDWFRPEKPGPLVGMHILQTGIGEIHADRWPDPRVILANCGGNFQLLGDPDGFSLDSFNVVVSGFIQAERKFFPLLQTTFPELRIWNRVVLELPKGCSIERPKKHMVQRIQQGHVNRVGEMSKESTWISKTWGGANGLAKSGKAWGTFVSKKIVSIACSFFTGEKYEDIGVTTEPEYRGEGMAIECTAALIEDIFSRGHLPSWTTSVDNLPSLRLARKLNFQCVGRDLLYVVNSLIPKPAVEKRPE